MKKKAYLVGFLLFLACTPGHLVAATTAGEPSPKEKATTMTEEQKQARITAIMQRVQEITAMDKSQLTKSERRELRKELKEMRQASRQTQGIYLSIGAVIIIILLLILLL